ncbi:MAG: ATP-binding protein [Candidatus Pacebacteria bacterium]|nr:ATP-binding protein [Candidatus Paceibacterota bacterium]
MVKEKSEKKEILEEELKRAKEDLEDLETYIEEFSYFLPLAICALNPPKFIIDVNQAFQRLTGYKSSEIIGESLDIIFSEKKEINLFLDQSQQKGGPKIKELILVSKEQKKIPVSVSVSVRKDNQGSFIGYFLALNDISETKKSKEKLEERVEERTRELEDSRKALMNMLEDVEDAREKAEEEKNKTLTIITNLSDGLLVFDRNNNLSLINPQAENFFSVKMKEIIGSSILELVKFPSLRTLVNLLGVEIKGIFRKELMVTENLTVEVSTVPMILGEEKLGTLVMLHDITREKMVERIKTEFVSLAAHQLRTPLSAIKWTLRMLLDGDLGEISKEQREFLDKTYQSNERMINLINDLLDVTRIEEGRYLYKPVLSAFENVVQFVVNSYQDEVKRKNITLEFKKPRTKLPRITIDVEKVRLAIQNLLDNAVRYTPSGGKITISLESLNEGKEIQLSIKDTGVGIPEDQKERVFTKFFRAANVMRMETEGSGLGLFITKNIIEAHGGKIWFESKEGEGTTFFFSIPIKKEFEEFLKEF